MTAASARSGMAVERRRLGWGQTVELTMAIAVRGLMRLSRRPSLIIPSVLMPSFFILAFGNSFSSLSRIDGYGTDNVFNWMAPYAILQGAAMGGMGAPGMMAQDLEDGFMDRMLLMPGRRVALLAGPVLYAALRTVIPTVIVLVIAYLYGARLDGVLGLGSLVVAAMGVGALFALLGMTFVMRLKSIRAMNLVQIFIFMTMFLSIGQVPLAFLSGWMHDVARVNPITPIMRLARQGFVGGVEWSTTWPGLLTLAVSLTLLSVAARSQLRRLAP